MAGDALAELEPAVGRARRRAGPRAASDALAERARDAGLPVELRVEGEPAALPAGVDLAAYRIVQEALANTAKHAGAAQAWVVVRYDAARRGGRGRRRRPRRSARRRDGGGHGLVGMRERVALYGGTLDVGPPPRPAASASAPGCR